MTSPKLAALVVVVLALVSCGEGGDGTESVEGTTIPSTTSPQSGPTTSGTQARPSTTAVQATTAPPPTTPQARPAPWRAAPVLAPVVLLAEWDSSLTRSDCPPLAFSALGDGAGGVPRPADFGESSWAVAWDKPGAPGQLPDGQSSPTAGRSTFGIAGVGGLSDSPFNWPYGIDWADGSSAGYGVEGGGAVEDGSTSKWLAYLRLSGHSCLYNVWSNLGRAHLEYLLGQLRSVEGHPL